MKRGSLKLQRLELLVKLERLNVYKCKKCPKVFPNKSVLKKHQSYHDEVFLSHVGSAYVSVERANIFKCDKCTKTFWNNRDFMLHKLVHVQENVRNVRKVTKFLNYDIVKPYKCPDCDVSYAAQSTLDEHSILHLPFPHICECGIGYYKKQDLKCHFKLVHMTKNNLEPTLSQNLDPQEEQVVPQKRPQDQPQMRKVSMKDDFVETNSNKQKTQTYTCDYCKKCFTRKYNLMMHVRTHMILKEHLVCKECNKKFRTKECTQHHISTVHTNQLGRPDSIKCQECLSHFMSLKCLSSHYLSCHTSIHCKKCLQNFLNSKHYEAHKLIENVQCEICDKTFFCENMKERHYKVHFEV